MATKGAGRRSQRDAVLAAFRATAADARTASRVRLRWLARRLVRRADGGDQRDLARLAAVRHEMATRGIEPHPRGCGHPGCPIGHNTWHAHTTGPASV